MSLTCADLERLLPLEGFDPESYRICGAIGIGECLVLDHTASGWEVYYAERGLKTGLRVFVSEAEACAYFLALLRRDPTTRQGQ